MLPSAINIDFSFVHSVCLSVAFVIFAFSLMLTRLFKLVILISLSHLGLWFSISLFQFLGFLFIATDLHVQNYVKRFESKPYNHRLFDLDKRYTCRPRFENAERVLQDGAILFARRNFIKSDKS